MKDERARMKMQIDLERRVAELPGEAEVTLPAAFVAGTLADLRRAREASQGYEDYRRRVDALIGVGEECAGDGEVSL